MGMGIEYLSEHIDDAAGDRIEWNRRELWTVDVERSMFLVRWEDSRGKSETGNMKCKARRECCQN